MALVEMLMPKMGESIMEGTILKWLKKVGDNIEEDESVLEVATDKVDTEVPAIHAGKLHEILAQEGEVITIGKPIAIIETEEGDTLVNPAAHITQANLQAPVNTDKEPQTAAIPAPQPSPEPEPETELASAPEPTPAATHTGITEGRFYSPLVMNIARQEGIAMRELDQVPGTGLEGRVTKHDIMAYLENRKAPQSESAPAPSASQTEVSVTQKPTSAPATAAPKPAVSVSGNAEVIEMDRMRKMIAQRMLESKRISAHVTSFVEADVTNMVLWRNRHKDAYQKREGEKLTFTPIFVEAVAKAIKDFPMINVSVEEDNIIKKRDINIGMAVALPSGNLIVPVIKNADQMNLNGLAKKVNDLANRARINKLTGDDLSDGTYTISNVGTFGNVMGTPIIVQPQVAILALGAIKKKPAVIETPEGDLIGIRHFMFLSHSYDHRVVDGSLGGMFVQRVAHYLESFDINTTI
ncbi:dihydrolipoamide acetyltransferase family protein [Adhaeribacter rhizoryzae]|uniref:Dihydrolipoamide acetyltransferase component of pyruvate dehydrogenase complex n=1 Tax=Adhaeribacter rhizoryzae TaxID=2607907 RepID=A0A5M6D159_9BACT|nr:dihydrolipoamide acetyltransferase family protein [Adhaeribacter rhizoryzae]KAA5539359.1 2-oxo acid dehydrogenase subunit E2 [Adhaeribacter rhizoryzae]